MHSDLRPESTKPLSLSLTWLMNPPRPHQRTKPALTSEREQPVLMKRAQLYSKLSAWQGGQMAISHISPCSTTANSNGQIMKGEHCVPAADPQAHESDCVTRSMTQWHLYECGPVWIHQVISRKRVPFRKGRKENTDELAFLPITLKTCWTRTPEKRWGLLSASIHTHTGRLTPSAPPATGSDL